MSGTIDTEAIWAALFARLRERTDGFTTFSRRRMDPGLDLYPALLLLDDAGDETPSDEDGLPPLWTLDGEIVVLTRTPPGPGAGGHGVEAAPTAQLNALVRSVRSALERDAHDADAGPYLGAHGEFYTNLGGLVHSLSLGRVEKGANEKTGAPLARMLVRVQAYATTE